MDQTYFNHKDFPETDDELIKKIFDGEIKIKAYKTDTIPRDIPRKTPEQEAAETRYFQNCPVDKFHDPKIKNTESIFNRWMATYADVWVPGGDPTLTNFKPCMEAVLLYHYGFSSDDDASYKSAVSAIADKTINHEVRRHLLLKILPKLDLRRTEELKSSEAKNGETVLRRAYTMVVAHGVRRDLPDLPIKEAAREINARLAATEAFNKDGESLMQGYSIGHLKRLIKTLGFKPGKPGRIPKK